VFVDESGISERPTRVRTQSTQVKDHSHHFGKTRKKTLDM
jgi:hypothetical protein